MSTKAQPQDSGFADRISFVDVMRGLAVLSMIWMHTADGWLDRSYRVSAWWPRIVTFGGLAAPLFFVLAGVGLGLAWHATPHEKLQQRLKSQVRRGLQLVVLGYALRLQMWMLDAGGYRRLVHWLTAIALLSAYVIAHRQLRPKLAFQWRRWLVACGLFTGALLTLQQTEPARLTGLLRVDVLQGLGASTAIVCVVCGFWPQMLRSSWRLTAFGLVVAVGTETARALLPGALPVPIAGYIAAWRIPPGMSSTTLFPLLPWIAYVFVGAAFALAWSRENKVGRGARALLITGAIGLLLAFTFAETQPWVHAALKQVPHATQFVRVVYRLGLAGALTVPAFLLARTGIGSGLQHLGTASLWIYWVHLEFSFGALAHPIAHSLVLAEWLFGFVVLSAAMFGLALAVNAQVGFERLRALTSRLRDSSAV